MGDLPLNIAAAHRTATRGRSTQWFAPTDPLAAPRAEIQRHLAPALQGPRRQFNYDAQMLQGAEADRLASQHPANYDTATIGTEEDPAYAMGPSNIDAADRRDTRDLEGAVGMVLPMLPPLRHSLQHLYDASQLPTLSQGSDLEAARNDALEAGAWTAGGMLGDALLAPRGLSRATAPDLQSPTPDIFSPRQNSQGELFPATAPPNPIVFHGTYGDFPPEEIMPWSHVGSEAAARQRVRMAPPTTPSPDRILPYELHGRIADIGGEPKGNFTSTSDVQDQLHIANGLATNGHITPEEHAWAIEPATYGSRFEGRNAGEVMQERLGALMERHDIGALGYRNSIEDRGSTSYIVPNPRANLEPRFPAFGSPDIASDPHANPPRAGFTPRPEFPRLTPNENKYLFGRNPHAAPSPEETYAALPPSDRAMIGDALNSAAPGELSSFVSGMFDENGNLRSAEEALGHPETPDHIWNDPRFSHRIALTSALDGSRLPSGRGPWSLQARFNAAGDRIAEELPQLVQRQAEIGPSHDTESLIHLARNTRPGEFSNILDTDLGEYGVGGANEHMPLLGSPDIAADPMANLGGLPPPRTPRFMQGAPNEDRYLWGRPSGEPWKYSELPGETVGGESYPPAPVYDFNAEGRDYRLRLIPEDPENPGRMTIDFGLHTHDGGVDFNPPRDARAANVMPTIAQILQEDAAKFGRESYTMAPSSPARSRLFNGLLKQQALPDGYMVEHDQFGSPTIRRGENAGPAPLLGSPDIAADPMANLGGLPPPRTPRFMQGAPNEDARWPMFGTLPEAPAAPDAGASGSGNRLYHGTRKTVDLSADAPIYMHADREAASNYSSGWERLSGGFPEGARVEQFDVPPQTLKSYDMANGNLRLNSNLLDGVGYDASDVRALRDAGYNSVIDSRRNPGETLVLDRALLRQASPNGSGVRDRFAGIDTSVSNESSLLRRLHGTRDYSTPNIHITIDKSPGTPWHEVRWNIPRAANRSGSVVERARIEQEGIQGSIEAMKRDAATRGHVTYHLHGATEALTRRYRQLAEQYAADAGFDVRELSSGSLLFTKSRRAGVGAATP